MEAKPLLPVVEETWLKDPVLREDFLNSGLGVSPPEFFRVPRWRPFGWWLFGTLIRHGWRTRAGGALYRHPQFTLVRVPTL